MNRFGPCLLPKPSDRATILPENHPAKTMHGKEDEKMKKQKSP